MYMSSLSVRIGDGEMAFEYENEKQKLNVKPNICYMYMSSLILINWS